MSLEYLDVSSGALTKYHHKHLWLGPAAKLQHVCGRVDRPTVSKAFTTIHNPQQVVTNVYKCSMMFYAPVPSTKLSIQEIQDGYILTVATHWQNFFHTKIWLASRAPLGKLGFFSKTRKKEEGDSFQSYWNSFAIMRCAIGKDPGFRLKSYLYIQPRLSEQVKGEQISE